MYVEYAFPRPRFLASTLIAVQAVLLGFTASNCIVFAKYTLFALGAAHSSDAGVKILAIGLLTAITLCHGCFPRVGVFVQNVLGWVKIALIAAISLTGLWVILWRPASPPQDPVAWNSLWEGSNWSWNLMSTSLFKVIYSYAGLNNVNNVLAEVHRPVKTLRVICPAALITAAALYLVANASYFLVIPLEDIKQGGELVGALLFDRLFGPHVGRVAFPLAIALSAGGNVMVVVYALVCIHLYNVLITRFLTCISRVSIKKLPNRVSYPTRVACPRPNLSALPSAASSCIMFRPSWSSHFHPKETFTTSSSTWRATPPRSSPSLSRLVCSFCVDVSPRDCARSRPGSPPCGCGFSCVSPCSWLP